MDGPGFNLLIDHGLKQMSGWLWTVSALSLSNRLNSQLSGINKKQKRPLKGASEATG